jgi:predicted nucleic acid-binding protein
MMSLGTTTSTSTVTWGTAVTFADTSGWYASLIPEDRDHRSALAWLQAYSGRLLTTDYILDEMLTLLRSRGYREAALDWGETMFGPNSPAVIHYLTPAEIAAAWNVFHRFADKDWSFTDCTSRVVMESLGVTTAFSFDQHFRQFGTVTVVP